MNGKFEKLLMFTAEQAIGANAMAKAISEMLLTNEQKQEFKQLVVKHAKADFQKLASEFGINLPADER